MTDSLGENEEGASGKKNYVWPIVFTLFPLSLAISVVLALWLKVSRDSEPKDLVSNVAYSEEYSVPSLLDTSSKLNNYMAERGFHSEEGLTGVRRVISLIQGSLGPQNLGYHVFTDKGRVGKKRLWKAYWVENKKQGEALVLAIPYDQKGLGVALGLAMAEWFVQVKNEQRYRIIFYPSALWNGNRLPLELFEGKTKGLLQLGNIVGASEELELHVVEGRSDFPPGLGRVCKVVTGSSKGGVASFRPLPCPKAVLEEEVSANPVFVEENVPALAQKLLKILTMLGQ